jgi:hypothetical protein
MAYSQALRKIDEKTQRLVFKSDVDHIINTFNIRGCKIDSLSMSSKIKDTMKMLKSDSTSPIGKLKLGDFLFSQLYNTVKMSDEKRNSCINFIQNTIYDCDLNMILKLSFTCYRDYQAGYTIAKKLITRGISRVIPMNMYFQILKYALRSPDNDKSALTEVILEELETVFVSEDISIFVKMEIADIFLLNRMEEKGNDMLQIIRELEGDYRHQDVTPLPTAVVTIVTDTQNVHSKDINDCNLKICVKLILIYEAKDVDMDGIVFPMLSLLYPEDQELIRGVLERVEIDTSIFCYGNDKFTLYNVFCALWEFIMCNKHKDQLLKRLIQEIVSMFEYCTTGHLARFVAVIQGFTDNEDLTLKISTKEHMKMVVCNILDKSLENASDEIVDSIISSDQTIFFKFVEKTLSDRLSELLKEYGDLRKDICSAVALYTGWKYWIITEEEVLLKSDPQDD